VQYAHLLLFCMAIIYIARAGLLVASIRPMRHRLQRLNDMAKHDDAAPSGLHRVSKQWALKTTRPHFLMLDGPILKRR
jgi:hypothetical protein